MLGIRPRLPWRPSGSLLYLAVALATLGILVWSFAALRSSGEYEADSLGARRDCHSLACDLSPLVVALGFWAAGAVSWRHSAARAPFELFLIALVLAGGKLATLGSDAGARLMYLALAWLPPNVLLLDTRLTSRLPSRRARITLGFLLVLASAASVPAIAWDFAQLRSFAWFGPWRLLVRFTAVLAALLTVVLLVRDYRRGGTQTGRQRIRLLLMGVILGTTPLLLLSLVPGMLGLPTPIPYEWTFPFLLLSAAAYAYTLSSRPLVRTQFVLSHLATDYLLVVLTLGVFLTVVALYPRISNFFMLYWLPLAAGWSVFLLLAVTPTRRALGRLVHWVWYGGEAEYETVVERLAESLPVTLDSTSLQRLLLQELSTAMALDRIALYVKRDGESLALLGALGFEHGTDVPESLPSRSPLASFLESVAAPMDTLHVRRAVRPSVLNAEERGLLAPRELLYWVPLVSGGILHGLLVVGTRGGGEVLSREDMRILGTLSRQAGIAAHNVRLIEEVRAGQVELARAHQQLLAAVEEERKRLGRELHDGPMQQLLGISYQLADREEQPGGDGTAVGKECELITRETLRTEVLGVTGELRRLAGDLLPSGVDVVGLVAALRGHVSRLRRELRGAEPELDVYVEEIGTRLPEPAATSLFRVAQEALRNALKHAEAQHVGLSLRLLQDRLVLRVMDDGCGFDVAQCSGAAVADDHFGLLTMRERVAQLGGELLIDSAPGAGTVITVEVPLDRDPGAAALPAELRRGS